MTDAERLQHTQEVYLSMGDEFLIQYLLCAHRKFGASQILSRLFSMGHSLELYCKAVLTSSNGVAPKGHDVANLISRATPALSLSPEEARVGKSLFGPDVTAFDLGAYYAHAEAMEIFQAQYFLQDLKYYLDKSGNTIYPSRVSLKPINSRYLKTVKSLRDSIKFKRPEQDLELIRLVGLLGFEINPALQVVGEYCFGGVRSLHPIEGEMLVCIAEKPAGYVAHSRENGISFVVDGH